MRPSCKQKMKFITELKNDLAGLATLRDWLGEGMNPVAPEQAEARARICAPCLKNQKGDWWDGLKGALADTIRKHLSLKKQLNISTTLDNELGTCIVCNCNQRLKVHVNIKHIKANTEENMVKDFPAYCWVRQQIEDS